MLVSHFDCTSHIETIKSRSYVGVQDGDGHFLPCSLGVGLVQGYDDIGITLSKPNLWADLEADLKREPFTRVLMASRRPSTALVPSVSWT